MRVWNDDKIAVTMVTAAAQMPGNSITTSTRVVQS